MNLVAILEWYVAIMRASSFERPRNFRKVSFSPDVDSTLGFLDPALCVDRCLEDSDALT